jgi:hypothetical protein
LPQASVRGCFTRSSISYPQPHRVAARQVQIGQPWPKDFATDQDAYGFDAYGFIFASIILAEVCGIADAAKPKVTHAAIGRCVAARRDAIPLWLSVAIKRANGAFALRFWRLVTAPGGRVRFGPETVNYSCESS